MKNPRNNSLQFLQLPVLFFASAVFLVSCRPHPHPSSFVPQLASSNSVLMTGQDMPENERWCDVAGNFYSTEFARNFSYADPLKKYRPVVRVSIQPRGDTLRGRVEATGLKPNFAYQLKLRGDFRDRISFELIGYVGRWRLGKGTNYTDDQYEALEDKSVAEAYILFDWLVTDVHGDAAKDFALCQSYHVLWEGASVSTTNVFFSPPRYFELHADSAELYARPKETPVRQALCAEVEDERYVRGKAYIELPAGEYTGLFALTEESFHSNEYDGGSWATVLQAPIRFEVVGRGGLE